MNLSLRIHQFGGPDVFQMVDLPVAAPASQDVTIRHTAIGLNYIDAYHRAGIYPLPLPSVIGVEAVGVVEALGEYVTSHKIGERVGYATGPVGAYCERSNYPAEKLIKIPKNISDETAAGGLLKGMTVEYLFHRTFPLRGGETILFHAIAGGVGQIACQWAKALGCTVIGTVGNSDKTETARRLGCDHVIHYKEEKFADRVMEITNGKGVPVVYDSVGKDTFQESLSCLSARGMLVSFGQSSGSIPDINLRVFAAKSLYFTRPSLFVYNSSRSELEMSAGRFFEMLDKKKILVHVGQVYDLKDVARAHRDLEARKLTGSTLLLPNFG